MITLTKMVFALAGQAVPVRKPPGRVVNMEGACDRYIMRMIPENMLKRPLELDID